MTSIFSFQSNMQIKSIHFGFINSLSSSIIMTSVLQFNFDIFHCSWSNLANLLNFSLFLSFLTKIPSQQDGQHLYIIGVEAMHLRMIVHVCVLGLERDCILAVLLPYLRVRLRALEEEWERLRMVVLCCRPPQ